MLAAVASDSTLKSQVANLKRVLIREYTSFFEPMETVCFLYCLLLGNITVL